MMGMRVAMAVRVVVIVMRVVVQRVTVIVVVHQFLWHVGEELA